MAGAFCGVASAAQDTVTKYTYYANGNLKTITDPRGLVTTYYYDALNRPYQRIDPPDKVGAKKPTVTIGYDGRDQVTRITDPRGLATIYTLDGLGRMDPLQSPDTGTTRYTYYETGKIKTKTDANSKTTTYSYDALDRLIQVSYQTGTSSVFEYDGGSTPQTYDLGHLTTITDESGKTRFNYDAFDHLIKKSQTTGSGATVAVQTVQYNYGALGRMDSITYPSGTVARYKYDNLGKISQVTLEYPSSGKTVTSVLLFNIVYTPFGAPKSWTWGNGTSYSRTIDLDGRVSQYPLGALTAATSGALSRTVNYDPSSRVKNYSHADTAGSITSAAAVSANQSFGWDDLDRLTSYSTASSSESYGYDLNGNRVTRTADTYVIEPLNNQLSSTFGPSPVKNNDYDFDGNLTNDGTNGYGYSDRGRLATATIGSNTVKYYYNALGQRVLKTGPTTVVATGVTRYVYDQAGHLIGEYDLSGKAIEETIYLGDLPVSVLHPG